MNVFTRSFLLIVLLTTSQYVLAGIITKDYRQLKFVEAVQQLEYLLSWNSSNRNWKQYDLQFVGVNTTTGTSCSSGAYQSATISQAYEIAAVANGFPLGEVRLEIQGDDGNGKTQEWLVLLNREVDTLPATAATYKDFSTFSYNQASDRIINNFLGWYEANRTVSSYVMTYIDPVSGASKVITGNSNTDFRAPLDQLGAGSYEFQVDVAFDDGTVSTRFISLNKLPGDVVSSSVDLLLSWNLPSQREDGTPIDAQDIAGYEVYMTKIDAGNNTTDQILAVSSATQTTMTVLGLSTGQYHLAISAIDTSGLKSQLSPVVTYTVN